MNSRKVGSGFSSGEADACAALLAAHFSGDPDAISSAEDGFTAATRTRVSRVGAGGNGYTAAQLSALLGAVPGALGLSDRAADACPPGEAGDVVVENDDGTAAARIEIKAQLSLEDFSWIQSADWVREETDFLGALLDVEPGARSQVPAKVLQRVQGAYVKDAKWDLPALWAADVAGGCGSFPAQVGVAARRINRAAC